MMPRPSILLSAIVAALVGSPVQAQTQDTTVNYGYDELGNLKSVSRPLGRQTSYQYDKLGRVTQENVTVETSTLTMKMGYDGQSQVVSVTDPRALVTTYTKDGLGNTSALSSPDTAETGYAVDADGNVISTTDARGKTTTMQYDALGRLTRVQYQSGKPTQFEYDGGAGGPASEAGNLTYMMDESGNTSYTHDLRGRVVSKWQGVIIDGSISFLTLRYTYGTSSAAVGKLESMTYPSGARVNYHYDPAGRVSSLTLNPSDGTGGTSTTETPLISNITWTASGAVSSWTWGSGTLPAYVRSYDLDGRLVSYPVDAAATMRTLTWNAANLITAYAHAGGGNPAQFDQTFGYDLADRLTSFTQSGATTTYQYDANGNRTLQTGPNGSYTFGTSNNRLISASLPIPRSYSYDAAGNRTGDGALTFTYSDRGRLAPVGGTANLDFLYNGLGQRVAKLSGSAVTYYAYDEDGRTVGQYGSAHKDETVYLGDMPVAVITPTAIHYVIADHLNTPLVLVKEDGSISWDWRNRDPFGNNAPMNAIGFAGYDHRFPGQIADEETGLFYNYFRDYDPQTGRYLESDPIGVAGGINTFLYTRSNPLSQVDPTGENPAAMIRAFSIGWRIGETINPVVQPLIAKALDQLLIPERADATTICISKLPRYNGPKPKFHVNPAHTNGRNPNKTPQPDDAEDVYARAVPDSATDAKNWYGRNADGVTYRYSSGNDGTAHFSGRSDVSPGIRNMTNYARSRLGGG